MSERGARGSHPLSVIPAYAGFHHEDTKFTKKGTKFFINAFSCELRAFVVKNSIPPI
jgi:hypothetical protein